jgi:DNA-binding winged helix-turn-helix (wHTH) protein
VWPYANVTENALAQAMSELRRTLGDDAGAPELIKTVHGVAFRSAEAFALHQRLSRERFVARRL